MAIEAAVAVGILVNCDLVLTAKVSWRRRRNLVIDGAPYAVVTDHLQASRKGILEILNHPEPPPFVKGDRNRLANDRLGQNQLDLKVVRNFERCQGNAGRPRTLVLLKIGTGSQAVRRRGFCRCRSCLRLSTAAWRSSAQSTALRSITRNERISKSSRVTKRCVKDSRRPAQIDPGNRLGGLPRYHP